MSGRWFDVAAACRSFSIATLSNRFDRDIERFRNFGNEFDDLDNDCSLTVQAQIMS
jgi:hypothetical protein